MATATTKSPTSPPPAAEVSARVKAQAAGGTPEPERITVKVGPLLVGTVKREGAALQRNPYPTIDEIASTAWSLINAIADTMATDPDYRAKVLNAKHQREAAKRAVKTWKLRKPPVDGGRGEAYTLAELAPVITLVRKRLNEALRETFARQDKRKREEARVAARQQARLEKERARVIVAAARRTHAAVLPEGSRPTKGTSRDKTRPALANGYVIKTGRGQTATWDLMVTDGYQAVLYPLCVRGSHGLVDGMAIGENALKAIEQAGAFRVNQKGLVQPVAYSTEQKMLEVAGITGAQWVHVPRAVDVGEAFQPPSDRGPRIVRKERKGVPAVIMPPAPPPSHRIELCFDAALLCKVSDAMQKGLPHVVVQIDARHLQRGQDNVRRLPQQGEAHKGVAMRVLPKAADPDGPVALQMTARQK